MDYAFRHREAVSSRATDAAMWLKTVGHLVCFVALPLWDCWVRWSKSDLPDSTKTHNNLESNSWYMNQLDSLLSFLCYAALPTGVVSSLLTRDHIIRHQKLVVSGLLVLLGNALSWKIFLQKSPTHTATSDETFQSDNTISLLGILTGYSALHKFGNILSAIGSIHALLIQACLIILLWFLLDMTKTVFDIVLAILLPWTPILVLYGAIQFSWLFIKFIVLGFCCIPSRYLLLEHKLDLALSWILLLTIRLGIALGGNMDWADLIIQGITETCYTVVGRIYLCAVVWHLCRGIWFILFRVFTRADVVQPLENYIYSEGLIMLDLILTHLVIGLPLCKYLSPQLFITLAVLALFMMSLNTSASTATLALAASQSKNLIDHLRTVTLDLLLLLLPIYITWYMTMTYGTSSWTYMVTHLFVMNGLHMFGLLQSYVVLSWDNLTRHKPWNDVDDALRMSFYFTTALQCTAVAYYIVCAVWVSVYEFEWQLWAHLFIAIFDLWIRILVVWATNIIRKEANKLYDSIPNATAQRLDYCEDVCSVCLERMFSAKLTPCGHLFHERCLRKWLYVKKCCPMCRQDFNSSASHFNV